MSLLGRLVLMLGADVGTFESDMGKAVRVAEQKTKQIERSAKGAGRALGEIGHALQSTNFGGLDKLTEGSRTATAAIKGLGASISLIGFASWPVLAITAAAGALGYFATQAGTAEREAAELKKSMLDLGKSAVDLATAPLFGKIAESTAMKMPIEDEIARLQREIEAVNKMMRDQNKPEMQNTGSFIEGNRKRIAELKAELDGWTEAERVTWGKISQIRDEFAKREEQRSGGTGGKSGPIVMSTMTVSPSPAMQAELENIKLAKRLAEEAKTPFDLLFDRMKQIEIAATALDDTGNPILDPEAAARLKQEALDQYYKDIAKGMSDVGTAAKDAGTAVVENTSKWSVFADQAARNIQGITADLIKGEMQGKSFGHAVVTALRDIAAEIAAQQLLRAIFGQFTGSGGFLGAFATALVAPGRASGGPTEAGKPYWVGDNYRNEPELFVPDVSGKIYPMNQLGGGGGSTVVQVDARWSQDPAAVYANVARAFKAFEDRLARKIQRNQLVPVGG